MHAFQPLSCLCKGVAGLFLPLLLMFALTAQVPGQPPKMLEGLTHRSWGIEDGLPDQEIQAVAQTSDNFLWLGTPHGLVRFDGFRFVDYGAALAPVLHQFGVSCLLATGDGSLWVGSNGGGVMHLGGGPAHVYGIREGFGNLLVRTLYQDSGGAIWAGTDHGIYRYSQDKFVRVPHLRDPSVTAISSDGATGLWFAGHRLIHYVQGVYADVTLPRQKSGLRIRSLAVDSKGTVWIGTTYGILRRDRDGAVHQLRDAPWNTRSLFIDGHGRMWVGTVGAGLMIRGSDGRFVPAGNDEVPVSKVVLACGNDASGDVWVGTQSGLARFSDTGMTLWRVAGTMESESASVFVDRDRSVWLSAGKVLRFIKGEKRRVRFSALDGLQVRTIWREQNGALWVGTMGHGAYRFVPGRPVQNFSSELGTGFVTGFLDGPDGSVWIATDRGVAQWKLGSVTSYQKIQGSPHQAVMAVAPTPEGGLWTGTPRGLFLLQNGHYQSNTVSSALGAQRIWSLHMARNSVLWIGTESGLYRLEQGSLAEVVLPRSTGATNAVLSVVEDGLGRMLIAEPTAIYRFPTAALEASNDLLPGRSASGILRFRSRIQPEIFAVAHETGAELYGGVPATAQADSEGGTWYATHLGLLHLLAAPIAHSEKLPPVMIERIAVDGMQVSAQTRSITLRPSTRNLEIQVSPVLLSSRTGLHLRRRLLGFESEWSELEPGVSSIYSKLPPGRYRFQVRASWSGEKGASSAELEIIQQSPIYRQPWFLAMCALLVAAIVWTYHRLRLHQLSLRFQAVMDERNRFAREMHDTLLQGCIGVSSMLEAAVVHQKQDTRAYSRERANASANALYYAREQITQTIQDARAAIWDLRHSASQDLGAALKTMLESTTQRSNIETDFVETGAPPSIRSGVQHELIMAFREAILNAVAHAQASRISVALEATSIRISVLVRDDGKGFDSAKLDNASNHFGLLSMQERMEEIGGSVALTSSFSMGTTVQLTLPLCSDVARAKSIESHIL